MRYFLIIFLVFSGVLSQELFAQNRSLLEQRARDELSRAGLDENEVRIRLLERGIDIDNVDITNPTQVQEAEKALREVMAELKAGKTSDPLSDINPGSEIKDANRTELKEVARESENVADAIQDGATLEEAVSEQLLDAQETALPKATVYGQQIFRNKSISLYRKSEDVKPPDSYVLGVGDIVGVSIWGYSQENFVFEINGAGYIKPEDIPRIYLKGITYGQAKDKLKNNFGQYYRFREHEFEVTLNFSRTINVNITGEVFNSGSFNIPAINSAFNALVAAGGPTNIGSVRKMKLKRVGSPDKVIDIYKYLLDPDAQEELYILENDYIHVPISDKNVKIEGAVKRPFTYELLEKENLKDLLFYAGGLKADAYKSNIKVKRFNNDKEILIDVNFANLEKSRDDFVLLNGDEVIIGNIPESYKNVVNVSGEVKIRGEYEIKTGDKLSSVLKKAILTEEAKRDIAYIIRTNDDETKSYIKVNIDNAIKSPLSVDNIVLNNRDKISIFPKSKFVNNYSFSIEGAVRDPGNHAIDASNNIRILDAITLAGGLMPNATEFAYIFKRDPSKGRIVEYKRIDLNKVFEDPNSEENTIIGPNDEIKIYNIQRYQDTLSVQIDGAVRDPGKFKFHESLYLKDLITLAGGLRMEAQNSRVDIFRLDWTSDKVTKTFAQTIELDDNLEVVGQPNFVLKPFDKIIVRRAPKFQVQRTVVIEGEVFYPGGYSLISEEERLSSVIERSGGLTEEAFPEGATLYRALDDVGYVVTKLDDVLKDKNSIYNFILKTGDRISIPKRKDFVTIIGNTKWSELYSDALINTGKITVAYHPGKDAKYYIKKYAGGLGKGSRNRMITVEHPNGEIEQTKGLLVFNNFPAVRSGSTIRIDAPPPKPEAAIAREREKVDWGRILADSVAQATAVLSLILLIQRVN